MAKKIIIAGHEIASKAYVDDVVAGIESSDGAILWDGDHTTEEAIALFQKMWDAHENGEALPDVRIWDENKIIQYRLFNVANLFTSKYAAFACVNTAINAVINRRAYYFTVTDGIVTSINEPQQTVHAVLSEYNADNSNGVLRANNTTEFTPTDDYNPATKKYIDDKVTETVIITIRNAGAGFEWGDVKTQLKEKFYDRHSITNQNSFKYLFFFNSGVMTNTDVGIPDGLYYYDAWGTGIDYLHSVDTQTSVVDGQLVKTYCKVTITKTKSTGSDKYDTISSIKAENIVLETSNLEGDLSDYYTKLETEDYVNATIDNALETVTLDKLPTDKVVQLRDGYGSVGTIYVNKIKSALKNTATGKSIKLIEEFVTNKANQEQYGQYFMIFGHKSATTNNKLLGYMTNYPELLKMNPDSTMNYYGIYEADKPVYSLTTNADSTEVIVAQISSTTAGTPYTSSWYWNTGTYYNNLYLRSNCDILYRTNSGNAIDGIYLELDGSTGHNGAGEIQIMPDCPVIFYLDGQMTPPHGETVLGYKEGTTFLVGGSLYKSVFDGIKSGSNVSYELYIGGDYDNYATKEELNNAIGNITSFSLMPVDVLPEVDIQTNVIYLVPSENPEETNVRNEYVYVNGAWEMVGTTAIDLSNYYTKEEVNAKVDSDSILTFNYTRETTATSEDLIAFFTTVIERYNATGMIPEVRIVHFSYPRTPFRITGWEVNSDTSFYKYDFNLWAFDMQDNVYTSPEYMYIIGGIKMTEDLSAISYVQFQSIEIDAMVRTFTTLDQTNGVRNLVLTTANTATYTPTANYHPSTKKYVDDSIAAIDLSAYMPISEVEANYYSKEEIDAKFAEIMTILPVASQEEVQEILNGEVSE